jgi:ribosomal protein S18 acetylase RimI-like enzyme
LTPRLARADEAAAVTALVERAYAPWVAVLGRRPAPMDDDYAPHIAAGEVWVLADAAGIGALCVLIEAADHLLLDNVAVDPARQEQGLGRTMIAHAEAMARARGHAELRLFTNELMERNIDLYRRLGFAETHRATVGAHRRVFMTKPV